jgi:hypothetical protein
VVPTITPEAIVTVGLGLEGLTSAAGAEKAWCREEDSRRSLEKEPILMRRNVFRDDEQCLARMLFYFTRRKAAFIPVHHKPQNPRC